MNLNSQIELKLRKFIKKYGKVTFIIIIAICIIIAINQYLKNRTPSKPGTSYEPQVSVLDSSKKVPDKVHKSMDDFVEEYVKNCNEGNYAAAYDMLSKDCKEEYFGNYEDFCSYLMNKFYTYRCYSIQNYSNFNDKYIYNVKIFDDFMATGLTGTGYRFQEEKIVASYDENKNIVFSVGNFIEKDNVQSVQENDYLKVDVKSKIINYDFEQYVIKLTNKSNYNVIVQNGEAEACEIQINLGQEVRVNEYYDTEIILKPGESRIIRPAFLKFYDDGDTTKEVQFTSVRIVDKDGNEIDKMSMNMGLF